MNTHHDRIVTDSGATTSKKYGYQHRYATYLILVMYLDEKYKEIICEKEDDLEIITSDNDHIFIQQTSKEDFRCPFLKSDKKIVMSVANFYRIHLKNSSSQFWFVSDCGIKGMDSTNMMFNDIFKKSDTLRTKVAKKIGIQIDQSVFSDLLKKIEAKIVDFDRVRTEIMGRFNDKHRNLNMGQIKEIYDRINQKAINLCTKEDTSREEFKKAFESHLPQRNDKLAILSKRITKDQVDLEINDMINKFERSQPRDLEFVKVSGFRSISKDYFENRKVPESAYDLWKHSFPLDLVSIKQGMQYTRPVVAQIIRQLDSSSKLLILAEMGYGKSTILMELICHYHGLGYLTLYNLDGSEIKNIDEILILLESSLKQGKEILLAVDNVHDEGLLPIFRIIDNLDSLPDSKKIKIVMAARIPEFDLLVEEKINKVVESTRMSLLKFQAKRNILFHLNHLNKEELKGFLEKYDGATDLEKLYLETLRHPVLVKHSIFGEGIYVDVKERSSRYLQELDSKRTMILCCLLELSSMMINDALLEDMNLLSNAYRLEFATLHKYDEIGWKTFHPVWGLYFLSSLFRAKNKARVLENSQILRNLIEQLFSQPNKLLILGVIRTLCYLSLRGILDIVTLEKVTKIPDHTDVATKCKLNTTIGMTYYKLDKIDRAIEKFDESLRLDPNNVDVMNDKGALFIIIGRYILEAISSFNEALSLKPRSPMPLNNLGLAFDHFGCFFTAIQYFRECNAVDPLFVKAWYNLGRALDELGEYKEAIKSYDKALEIDPDYADAWHNKGVSFQKQLLFNNAIECYDKAVDIDPGKNFSHLGKYLALKKDGGFTTKTRQ